jgi:hypothetical protein
MDFFTVPTLTFGVLSNRIFPRRKFSPKLLPSSIVCSILHPDRVLARHTLKIPSKTEAQTNNPVLLAPRWSVARHR